MDPILVGMDDSRAAHAALGWARAVATATGAPLVAIHAFQPPYMEISPEDHDRHLDNRRREAAGWIGDTQGVDVDVRPGDPREVLLAEADQRGAGLIVVGRTGDHDGPGFLHLGSVAEYLAHHTTVPVAAIPAGFAEPPRRIVVGVDGSKAALTALDWAGTLARSTTATVVAVQVHEPVLEWTPADSPENWRRDVERHIREWTASLTEAGVAVFPVAKRDLNPADGLLGVAANRAADLVVVGTRGLGGFIGLRAGGVALRVLHNASVPVVLVPAD